MDAKLLNNSQWSISSVNGRQYVLIDVLKMSVVMFHHLCNFFQLGADKIELLVGHRHSCSLRALISLERLETILHVLEGI